MEVDRFTLLFVIIFIVFVLPGGDGDPPTTEERERLQTFQAHKQAERWVLGNSTYASGYGNVTGFGLTYEDVIHHRNVTHAKGEYCENQKWSILPDTVSDQAREVWGRAELDKGVGQTLAYPLNLTGLFRGTFNRHNQLFVDMPMPLPGYLAAPGNATPNYPYDPENPQDELDPDSSLDSWQVRQDYRPGNVTDPTGQLTLKIIGEQSPKIPGIGDATYLTLALSMADRDEFHVHDLVASGVYFQDTGDVLAVTNSAKFAAPYAFPHLALNEPQFRKAQALMLHRINQSATTAFTTAGVNAALTAAEQCEYVMYLHLEPVPLTKQQLREIDEEYAQPQGRPVRAMPPMAIVHGIFYSPDCGVMLAVDPQRHLVGVRRPVRIAAVRKLLLGGLGVLAAQLVLSIRQMNRTNSPSTLSRLSFWTVALMTMVDGTVMMFCLLASAMEEELYLPLVVAAFVAFGLASIFGLRYMIMIYITQVNERAINLRTALRGPPMDGGDPEPLAEPLAEPLLPVAETPPAPAPPVPAPQPLMPVTEASVTNTLYSRVIFTQIAFAFLILNAFLWRRALRYGVEFVVVMVLNSFWLPQTYRNVLRGSRRSFAWEFILCSTAFRLLPVYYLTLYRNNPFGHHYAPALALTVTLWHLAQIALLYAQALLGARFFLPESLLPKAYEYHPLLSLGDLESHALIGEMTVASDETTAACACAVCMSEVEVPIHSERHPDVSPLSRTKYMVTPCRHVFHTECLEGWMRYKLQCPVCRNGLPPL